MHERRHYANNYAFSPGGNKSGIDLRKKHGGVRIDDIVLRNELLARRISEMDIRFLQIANEDDLIIPHIAKMGIGARLNYIYCVGHVGQLQMCAKQALVALPSVSIMLIGSGGSLIWEFTTFPDEASAVPPCIFLLGGGLLLVRPVFLGCLGCVPPSISSSSDELVSDPDSMRPV